MLIALAVALVLQGQEPPPRFVSSEYGFIIRAPEGFLREGDDPLRAGRDLVCFVKISTETTPWVRLCVEKGSRMPSSAYKQKFTWKGQSLDGGYFTADWDRTPGKRVEVVGALIPLRKEPIAIVGMAPEGSRADASAAVVSALMQFEADAVSRTEEMEKLGENVGLVAGIIIAIGVGMWIAKRKPKES